MFQAFFFMETQKTLEIRSLYYVFNMPRFSETCHYDFANPSG